LGFKQNLRRILLAFRAVIHVEADVKKLKGEKLKTKFDGRNWKNRGEKNILKRFFPILISALKVIFIK